MSLEGSPTYEELIKQGIEALKSPDRPNPENIQQEALRMATNEIRYDGKTIYGDDSGAFVARNAQKTNKIVRERFEQAVIDNNVTPLKGTLWESWTAEDCRTLLDVVNTLKGQMKIEVASPELYAFSYEDRLIELEDFANTHKIDNRVDEALDRLQALSSILKKLLDKDPSDAYFSKKYQGWTEEQIKQFYNKSEELFNDLAEYADNMSDRNERY